MASAFPKIFQLGTKYTDGIYEGKVQVTEKVDGSQFGFGKIDGEVFVRSKGAKLYFDNPEKMFKEGIDYIKSIEDKIPDNMIFYAEYLKKPKHNTLAYDRIPKNHLALFGVADIKKDFKYNIKEYANLLDIDHVPVIFEGEGLTAEKIPEFLERVSYLGGQKIEGVVVKNFNKDLLLGGQIIPILSGKYVSEAFKEVHRKSWGKENTGRGKWETFKEQYKTEARWNKAIIHLKEKGELTGTPKDIGKLMKEVNIDITKECKEEIKDFLWKEFGKEVFKTATRNFPEWYKEQILKGKVNE